MLSGNDIRYRERRKPNGARGAKTTEHAAALLAANERKALIRRALMRRQGR